MMTSYSGSPMSFQDWMAFTLGLYLRGSGRAGGEGMRWATRSTLPSGVCPVMLGRSQQSSRAASQAT